MPAKSSGRRRNRLPRVRRTWRAQAASERHCRAAKAIGPASASSKTTGASKGTGASAEDALRGSMWPPGIPAAESRTPIRPAWRSAERNRIVHAIDMRRVVRIDLREGRDGRGDGRDDRSRGATIGAMGEAAAEAVGETGEIGGAMERPPRQRQERPRKRWARPRKRSMRRPATVGGSLEERRRGLLCADHRRRHGDSVALAGAPASSGSAAASTPGEDMADGARDGRASIASGVPSRARRTCSSRRPPRPTPPRASAPRPCDLRRHGRRRRPAILRRGRECLGDDGHERLRPGRLLGDSGPGSGAGSHAQPRGLFALGPTRRLPASASHRRTPDAEHVGPPVARVVRVDLGREIRQRRRLGARVGGSARDGVEHAADPSSPNEDRRRRESRRA